MKRKCLSPLGDGSDETNSRGWTERERRGRGERVSMRKSERNRERVRKREN